MTTFEIMWRQLRIGNTPLCDVPETTVLRITVREFRRLVQKSYTDGVRSTIQPNDYQIGDILSFLNGGSGVP